MAPKCLQNPPKTLKKRKQKKQRKNDQKMMPQKPVLVREREARFILDCFVYLQCHRVRLDAINAL